LELGRGNGIDFLWRVGYAKLTNHWDTPIPQQVYFEPVPQAGATAHPQ